MLLTIFLISSIVFFVIRVIPGDPALVVAGMDATEEAIQAIRTKLGTDQPLATQYVGWLWKVVRFDFGDSLISGQSAIGLVFQRFPLTLSLALLGILISIVIAIPLGRDGIRQRSDIHTETIGGQAVDSRIRKNRIGSLMIGFIPV